MASKQLKEITAQEVEKVRLVSATQPESGALILLPTSA